MSELGALREPFQALLRDFDALVERWQGRQDEEAQRAREAREQVDDQLDELQNELDALQELILIGNSNLLPEEYVYPDTIRELIEKFRGFYEGVTASWAERLRALEPPR
jgi:hypothetical protein